MRPWRAAYCCGISAGCKMDKTLAWLWLADAVGSACHYANKLLDLWPDPEELWQTLQSEEDVLPGFVSKGAAIRLRQNSPFDFEERLDHCLLTGVSVLTPDNPDYPQQMRDLPDLPLVLYATGDESCLNGARYVGMVGTRRPDAYGRQAAYDLSRAVAEQGVVVVSGLADGLDSAGHRAAVDIGAPTIAFLGTAIDVTFPSANGPLRQQIEEVGGAVCSEYPPRYPGKTKGTFLARNRLIAAQSEVVCVVEARMRSGTLNTVSHAEAYGRPVLAVPGSIYSGLSRGTNELLRTHRADPLCQVQDIFGKLGLEVPTPEEQEATFSLASVSEDARTVYAQLGPTARGVDALCAVTGLPAGRVLAACTELELFGGAQALPGRRYIAL